MGNLLRCRACCTGNRVIAPELEIWKTTPVENNHARTSSSDYWSYHVVFLFSANVPIRLGGRVLVFLNLDRIPTQGNSGEGNIEVNASLDARFGLHVDDPCWIQPRY